MGLGSSDKFITVVLPKTASPSISFPHSLRTSCKRESWQQNETFSSLDIKVGAGVLVDECTLHGIGAREVPTKGAPLADSPEAG